MQIVYVEGTEQKIEETQDIEYLRKWARCGLKFHLMLEEVESAIKTPDAPTLEEALWEAGCDSLTTDSLMLVVREAQNLMETRPETNKIQMMNYFHRVFLGWLASEIQNGNVSPKHRIEDMAPIDLNQNGDLFQRFLREENQEEKWRQLETDHGPIGVLTYSNR